MKKLIKKYLHRINKWAWRVRWTVHIYQRLKYGVSFMDSWGLNSHVLSVLKFGLERMSKSSCTYPHNITYEKWQLMKKDMLFFVTTMYNNIEGNKIVWITPSDKIREKWRQEKKENIMNKKDCKRYYRGRRYLLVYFNDLWD